MESGCTTFPWIKSLKDIDEGRYKRVCHTIREDGAYIEAGENDNLIVQKIEANPNAVGIFGYSFLEENADKLVGSVVEGQSPTFESIAAGKYPASRALYIYVKKAHLGVIPGLKEFVAEYVSEAGSRPMASHAAATRSRCCVNTSTGTNAMLNSLAYVAARRGVRVAPLPPTMTGTGRCTGFGSAGDPATS